MRTKPDALGAIDAGGQAKYDVPVIANELNGLLRSPCRLQASSQLDSGLRGWQGRGAVGVAIYQESITKQGNRLIAFSVEKQRPAEAGFHRG